MSSWKVTEVIVPDNRTLPHPARFVVVHEGCPFTVDTRISSPLTMKLPLPLVTDNDGLASAVHDVMTRAVLNKVVPLRLAPRPEMWITGSRTGALNVKVSVPRLAQRRVAVEQPVGRTSISTASVFAAIAGDSMAVVTPPVAFNGLDGSNIEALPPATVTVIVVVPGYVLVTGLVPLLVEGV
ncbi:MAG TPA: hypothetical protein VFV06_00285 [Sphingorhabdus sp.]|nr:hypothetical protein [Sphingorhabdus sp.]